MFDSQGTSFYANKGFVLGLQLWARRDRFTVLCEESHLSSRSTGRNAGNLGPRLIILTSLKAFGRVSAPLLACDIHPSHGQSNRGD